MRVSKSEMMSFGPMNGAICAMRVPSGAVSSRLFKGFCGETSQMMRSSPSLTRAVSATWRWPSCAGLNEPPNRPIFMPGSR